MARIRKATIACAPMTKTPNNAELRIALQAWREKCEAERAAAEKQQRDAALAAEWRADEALVKHGANVRLLPGMSAHQLAALQRVLESRYRSDPTTAWVFDVRRERAQRMTETLPPASYVADSVRLQRREAFIARLREKEEARRTADRPTDPTRPTSKKPKLSRT